MTTRERILALADGGQTDVHVIAAVLDISVDEVALALADPFHTLPAAYAQEHTTTPQLLKVNETSAIVPRIPIVVPAGGRRVLILAFADVEVPPEPPEEGPRITAQLSIIGGELTLEEEISNADKGSVVFFTTAEQPTVFISEQPRPSPFITTAQPFSIWLPEGSYEGVELDVSCKSGGGKPTVATLIEALVVVECPL